MPIHFSENLKMKNENFSSFSFLLKIENDLRNLSFKIHFSFFRKNENENFFISVWKKWKFNELKFSNSFSHFQKKNENLNAFTNPIFVDRRPGEENTRMHWSHSWRLYLLQTWLIKILLSTWSLSHEEREKEESKEKLENLR